MGFLFYIRGQRYNINEIKEKKHMIATNLKDLEISKFKRMIFVY